MRLSEVYTSVQGEGPNVGKPTTFVRFGGCNLRCPGWGKGLLPDGTIVQGCDTIFAVYPEWRSTWEVLGPDEILERVPNTPQNVCITGGEPLTQRSKDLSALVVGLVEREHTIDLFTNGSRLLPYWARLSMTTVIMDYKLPGSGEFESFLPENLDLLQPKDAIKFVCKDRNDFEVAKEYIDGWRLDPEPQIFFGPVWNELDPVTLATWVEEEVPRARLNIQSHKYIFGDIRGV